MEPIKKLSKAKQKVAIREELIKQLRLKRADTDVFMGLVDDYLFQLDLKNKLMIDIRKRGILITEKYRESTIEKQNPSVKSVQDAQKLMLMILKEMDLKTNNVGGEDDDDY